MSHSEIGASNYYRWKKCPGSRKACRGVKTQESSYAQEGTLAHEIAAKALRHYFFGGEKPDIPPGYAAENMSAIREYVETVKEEALRAQVDPKKHVFVEHKFDLQKIYPGLYGTADCVLYDALEKRLLVVDYKHGAGIPVDVENNLQLQYYGLGALYSTSFPCGEVEIMIVQPRCDHKDGSVRRWKTSATDLLDFAATLAEDAKATEAEDAPVVPGDHCRFCPAAASNCPILFKKAQKLAELQFSPSASYDSKKLVQALDFIPVARAWIAQVESFAYQEAVRGRPPPGYKLVNKRATRKWKFSDEDVAKKLEKMAVNYDFYNHVLMSPAQVEKILPKNSQDQLAALIVKESSGTVLVKDDDKRPAVPGDVKSTFKKIEELPI